MLRWTPVREDLEDGMAVYRREVGGPIAWFPYVMAGVCLLIGLSGFLLGQLTITVIASVGAVLMALFGRRLMNRSVWKNPLVREPREAVATPSGLRVWTRTATTELHWPAFSHAVETNRSFVLIGPRQPGAGRSTQLIYFLPKTALPHPVEVDRLRALLAAVLAGGVRRDRA
jgi:YcxB-like protein